MGETANCAIRHETFYDTLHSCHFISFAHPSIFVIQTDRCPSDASQLCASRGTIGRRSGGRAFVPHKARGIIRQRTFAYQIRERTREAVIIKRD